MSMYLSMSMSMSMLVSMSMSMTMPMSVFVSMSASDFLEKCLRSTEKLGIAGRNFGMQKNIRNATQILLRGNANAWSGK